MATVISLIVGVLAVVALAVGASSMLHEHEMVGAHSGAAIRLQSIEEDVREIRNDLKVLLRRVPE